MIRIKSIIALAAVAAAVSTTAFAKANKNISEEERAARMEERKAQIEGIVDAQDLDGDGFLSELELAAVFEEIRALREERINKMKEKNPDFGSRRGGDREPPSPAEVAARVIERLDDDADGAITRDQLLDAIHEMGKRRGERRQDRRGERGTIERSD